MHPVSLILEVYPHESEERIEVRMHIRLFLCLGFLKHVLGVLKSQVRVWKEDCREAGFAKSKESSAINGYLDFS